MEGLVKQMNCLEFYRGKRVFVTGHTGFKGTWLCYILAKAGAIVTGYALPATEEPNLFSLSGVENRITSISGDVRNREDLLLAFEAAQPTVVFHLAAQPIVRLGYQNPAYTYETNVMGTVNILECMRKNDYVRSFLNITTDKVYKNKEWLWGYRENEVLDGFDPYSNSKSCSELVTHCYCNSFFQGKEIAVSTARAGNVIGGGDFSKDRIIPDCVRAMITQQPVPVRNPGSIRPYQHVLEVLFAYLMIAQAQYEDQSYAGWYNIGPNEDDCVTTGKLVSLFCEYWGTGAKWISQTESHAPREANFLKLECSKLKSAFNWQPCWNIQQTIEKTVKWTKIWLNGKDVSEEMDAQILQYSKEFAAKCGGNRT